MKKVNYKNPAFIISFPIVIFLLLNIIEFSIVDSETRNSVYMWLTSSNFNIFLSFIFLFPQFVFYFITIIECTETIFQYMSSTIIIFTISSLLVFKFLITFHTCNDDYIDSINNYIEIYKDKKDFNDCRKKLCFKDGLLLSFSADNYMDCIKTTRERKKVNSLLEKLRIDSL